jgi:cytochrome c551
MTRATALCTLLAAAALAGCGSDDGGGGSGGGGDKSQEAPAKVVAAGDPAKGKEVFGDNCAVCHGADGGGGTGPQLKGQEAYTNPDVVVGQVREGGGGMPAFGDQLSAQELSDVSAYVVEDLAR